MKLNHYLDGGTAQVFKQFQTGQDIHTTFTEGIAAYAYPRGSKLRSWSVKGVFLAMDCPAMGLFPAKSFRANELRARQFAEFVGNRDMMSCYIEWFAGGSVTSEDQPDDGWYIITDFKLNLAQKVFGIIDYDMTVTYVNPGNLRNHKLWWRGGLKTTNFSQTGVNMLATPIDTTVPLASISRASLEGTIKIMQSPALAAEAFAFNTTTPNLLKGGVHVYDTVISSALPGATAPTNTMSSPTWVETFGTDHRFTGDIVVMNSLLMVIIPAMQQPNKLMTVYGWDSVGGVWMLAGDIAWADNASTVGTLLSASARVIGPEVTEIRMMAYTTTAEAEITLKITRGSSVGRLDLRPWTASTTSNFALQWIPATTGWYAFNSGNAVDTGIDTSLNLPVVTDYGMAAWFNASAAKHFIAGILYQNQPLVQMPSQTSTTIGLGDSGGAPFEITTSYGFFVTPYQFTDKATPQAKNGTLAGGFTTAVDGNAHSGTAAKLPNTTVVGASDLFEALYTPPAGTYKAFFRLRVANSTGLTSELKISVVNGSGTDQISRSFRPVDISTTYTWYPISALVTLDGATNVQMKIANLTTASQDYFADQAILIPITLTDLSGPGDQAQQFLHAKTVRVALG